MPILCFGTRIKPCKTIYILKDYTDVAHIKILRASMTSSPIYKETFIVV